MPSPRPAALAVLAALFLIAGCGEKEDYTPAPAQASGSGDDGSVSSGELPPSQGPVPPPGEPGGRLEAEIEITETRTRGDGGAEVTYAITNTGKVSIGFGVCGTLEKRSGDAWIPAATDQACPELLAVLAPGETNETLTATTTEKLAAPARIVHQVFSQDESARRLTLRAQLPLSSSN